ncbi:MAG TPA: type II toxin-antitoxin system VapC family toxin [Thermoanaerobaculia bacterium]|nr:type II toxin-antitoxin system VapC family toxin [Thermoanaerobaculia bacterium]
MPWVVDTCVLIDVLEDDPQFGQASALTLDAHAKHGLVVCPITYAELAPSFGGDRLLQDEFLSGVGADYQQDWAWDDTLSAHDAWNRFVRRRRAGVLPKRPLADILIGAFASRHDGLITRNPDDFKSVFPDLPLSVPDPNKL